VGALPVTVACFIRKECQMRTAPELLTARPDGVPEAHAYAGRGNATRTTPHAITQAAAARSREDQFVTMLLRQPAEPMTP
jgi:hypothetical protein